jgi:hypothetical protein
MCRGSLFTVATSSSLNWHWSGDAQAVLVFLQKRVISVSVLDLPDDIEFLRWNLETYIQSDVLDCDSLMPQWLSTNVLGLARTAPQNAGVMRDDPKFPGLQGNCHISRKAPGFEWAANERARNVATKISKRRQICDRAFCQFIRSDPQSRVTAVGSF